MKKLMKVDIHHKNDESMLNYYIAMDYKSKDKIKIMYIILKRVQLLKISIQSQP